MPQDDAEQRGADPAGRADGRRYADMAVAGKQGERSGDRGGEPGEGGQHRRARVLVSERNGAEDFLQRVPGQSGADGRQRRRDCRGIARAERAALEQSARNRLRQKGEGDGGGQRQAERDLEAARLRAAIPLPSPWRTAAAIVGTSTAAMAIEATPSGSS